MTRRQWARIVATLIAAFAAATAGGVTAPTAAAQGCPDVEVVFARGTGEPPGVGGVGQAFVDAVRAQAAPKTVGVYAVNYAASNNFDAREEIAQTVIDGIRDEADHVQSMAANCPGTRMVLGGYSQGALVSGFATSDVVPAMVPAAIAPRPMPPAIADHVAAVVLFGTPSAPFLQRYGAPAVTIGPRYADKTLQLCAQGDTICSGAPDGGPTVAHALYPINGMVNEGAAYAVGRL
ncbi:cutinase family protein [Mycolicibacterium sp. 018/SC-01/001]|uniref:cutinase family protein n=1 Tax=Mycolicibacterium sp. 018/SC-01/001 TaxID=2592069 RepID=UPI00117F6CC3|nr:cutinase family protein [Mycolicibacterium sp. 018/SC-01/001]TRW89029.1 cutinase family protein [Mycolicibacterium sp. 018/SC-01/001]